MKGHLDGNTLVGDCQRDTRNSFKETGAGPVTCDGQLPVTGMAI
jgi:hypothetical protein